MCVAREISKWNFLMLTLADLFNDLSTALSLHMDHIWQHLSS
jgi:hypothetical protein